jgi:4-alpha-glucanotransferase
MASVTFRVHYATQWGENLFFERRVADGAGGTAEGSTLPMRYAGDGFWMLRLDGVDPHPAFEYRYAFQGMAGQWRREPVFRRFVMAGLEQVVWDHWLAPELPEGAFLRQAFAGVVFQPRREPVEPIVEPGARRLRLTLRAARVSKGRRICVTGGHPMLGDWDPARARVMCGVGYPVWEADLPATEFQGPVEFKFGLWDEVERRLVQYEEGPNRGLEGVPAGPDVLVLNCEHYRHPGLWRGAGVAVPVFGLRSERGYGVGEFLDLVPFAEWAAACNLRLIQVLPVTDTSSDFSWQDSYPYKAISSAALHPIYLNLDRIFADCGVPLPTEYAARRDTLNRLPQVDYEAVLADKLQALRRLFAEVGLGGAGGGDIEAFMRKNADWLEPYAAFCRLRDLHRTADFACWGEDATCPAERIAGWFRPEAPEREAVLFHCWVQYHLDRQLREALAAGHARGVAFKGDLPIGIDRTSVEAWTEPELFRMDRQTGAPPDAFAVLGQNWGFPTYNWPRMEADGYAWWRRRLRRMSAVFDALRLDHVLGFFRIWEIPQPHREGIHGHFNPALPLSRDEIRRAGFGRDPGEFARGTVAEGQLEAFFGAAAPAVREALLACDRAGFCRLRPEYETAEARRAWIAEAGLGTEAGRIEEGLTRLSHEVLFVEDPDQRGRFHPRIELGATALVSALRGEEQAALGGLYDEYYHHRHTRFWADEALKKLPVLLDASPMLLCGEDLGMVPESVPMVLGALGLLSIEVQRWPKRPDRRLARPAEYPYLSVCTTSTHDMSTLRGWWEDPDTAAVRQEFWTEVLGRPGTAPEACSAELCRWVIEQNLAAASMWCVLPLQDWLSVDAELRHPVAAAERINIPAAKRHYWRYRMHVPVEALLQAEGFKRSVAELVEAAGRNPGD